MQTKQPQPIVSVLTAFRPTSNDTDQLLASNGALRTVSPGYPAKLREAFPVAASLIAELSVGYLAEKRKSLNLRTLKDCVSVPYPTLLDVAGAHTEECATLLLETYITNLNDSVNIVRMTEEQITELAHLIFFEAPYLKLTEIHEFFRRVKSAAYGEYYGSLDCVKIMADFRLFLKDRVDAINRVQAEHRHNKRVAQWQQWIAEGKVTLNKPNKNEQQ